jgi:uncharacterized membrane protein
MAKRNKVYNSETFSTVVGYKKLIWCDVCGKKEYVKNLNQSLCKGCQKKRRCEK